MEVEFKLSKLTGCGIVITGLEQDCDQYLPEGTEVISTRDYMYSETATVNVVQSVTSEEEETIEITDVVLHNTDCIDESEVQLPKDGLYKITHIILPTEKWLDSALSREPAALNRYSLIYFINSETKEICKLIQGGYEKATIEELLEVNPDPRNGDVLALTTTIIRGEKYTFTICKLMDCFYNLCKDLLGTLPDRCNKNKLELESATRNRDIIWMTINVIKYLLEKGQHFEAQRILETVLQCNTICNDNSAKKAGGGGCGCNSKSKG